jgi:GT2 family glycosyltransferase
MPVYNTEAQWLRRAIESVRGQLYPHWELCIADDCSTALHVRRILEEFAARDERIKVAFRNTNGHISAASNTALGLASGEFVALLDHDDELTEHALYLVAEELSAHPEADLIYSDEDKINSQGELTSPHFKTDWNPDLFYSLNFVSHLGVYRRAILEGIGGFRTGYEGSQDYDLALRVIEQIPEQHIRHIPHVLYHWRESPSSVGFNVEAKAYAHEHARRALRSHFENTKKIVDVVPGHFIFHRVVYPVPDPPPLVTLIAVAQGNGSTCLHSLAQMVRETDYAQLELILICDRNQTAPAAKVLEEIKKEPRVKVRQQESTVNGSALINLAVREAQGEIVGVLSPNLKVVAPGWLTEMVSHALRPEIGVVGAKVSDSNDLIHHAGVILGIKGIAGMAHQGFQKKSEGYVFRTQVMQNFSAVSGGCLLLRSDVFEEAGGFDETNLPDLFRDLDLCLRIREKGYRVLWTPYAELQETGPTPAPSSPEVSTPADYLKSRWADALISDPYYNPNLSLEFEDFRLAFPPRMEKLIANESD